MVVVVVGVDGKDLIFKKGKKVKVSRWRCEKS